MKIESKKYIVKYVRNGVEQTYPCEYDDYIDALRKADELFRCMDGNVRIIRETIIREEVAVLV